RRRHTRFSRDWSSDVCSSDLAGVGQRALTATSRNSGVRYVARHCGDTHQIGAVVLRIRGGAAGNITPGDGVTAHYFREKWSTLWERSQRVIGPPTMTVSPSPAPVADRSATKHPPVWWRRTVGA